MVSPEAIAAAWATWHSRHGGKLGPGPAFSEAIAAAVAVEGDAIRRAGLLAGLREAAGLASAHASDGANLDERSALVVLEQAIRARIAALEEEGRKG